MLINTLVLCGQPGAALGIAEAAVERDPWNPHLAEMLEGLRSVGSQQ